MSKNKGDTGTIAAAVGFIFLWLVSALLSLGLTATMIWAIVQVVSWITSQ